MVYEHSTNESESRYNSTVQVKARYYIKMAQVKDSHWLKFLRPVLILRPVLSLASILDLVLLPYAYEIF